MSIIASAISSLDILSCVKTILSGELFTIPVRRQMRVFQTFTNTGTVIINGDLIID